MKTCEPSLAVKEYEPEASAKVMAILVPLLVTSAPLTPAQPGTERAEVHTSTLPSEIVISDGCAFNSGILRLADAPGGTTASKWNPVAVEFQETLVLPKRVFTDPCP